MEVILFLDLLLPELLEHLTEQLQLVVVMVDLQLE
jgi:hypothetical protein